MKHRSVIAFVIVVAALFAAPQLSHDLRELRGALASRLRVELLHAFLNLPSAEPTAAHASPAAQPLLASCTKKKASEPAAKADKGTPRVQRAIIGDPLNDPVGKTAGLNKGASRGGAEGSLPEVRVETEVAMIIPPGSGIDPHGLASAIASRDSALADVAQLREDAELQRVATFAARADVKGAEWQKVGEDVSRRINRALPGTYEFRVIQDGAKTKVLKFNCADCPAPAPHLPRAPRQVATGESQPAAAAPAASVGE